MWILLSLIFTVGWPIRNAAVCRIPYVTRFISICTAYIQSKVMNLHFTSIEYNIWYNTVCTVCLKKTCGIQMIQLPQFFSAFGNKFHSFRWTKRLVFWSWNFFHFFIVSWLPFSRKILMQKIVKIKTCRCRFVCRFGYLFQSLEPLRSLCSPEKLDLACPRNLLHIKIFIEVASIRRLWHFSPRH